MPNRPGPRPGREASAERMVLSPEIVQVKSVEAILDDSRRVCGVDLTLTVVWPDMSTTEYTVIIPKWARTEASEL